MEELNDSVIRLIYEFAREFKLFKNKRTFVTYRSWTDEEFKEKKEIFKKALSECKAVEFLDEEMVRAYKLARSDLVKTLRSKKKSYFEVRFDAETKVKTPKKILEHS